VAYPGRTTLIAIRCEYSSVAFKVNAKHTLITCSYPLNSKNCPAVLYFFLADVFIPSEVLAVGNK